jgi:regulator of cell morphogenesis and NO signaling
MIIDPSTTVRDLIARIPSATSVFADLRIDYCCRGARSLRDACADDGVALDVIVPRLEQAAARASEDRGEDWSARPLVELTAHINRVHHTFTREALDRVGALARKVATVHGEKHPELLTIRDLVAELDDELRGHLLKEERILFPYIEDLENATRAGRRRPFAPFGDVANPVRMMMEEHDHAGRVLREMRAASSDYALPEGACGSYAALYAGLAELERDLHEHIHLESNVLFPRAIQLESS